jgi:hypothetical protein
MDQRRVLDEVREWAAADDNVRLVVLTRSVALGDVDELSDLNLELYVLEPAPLLDRRENGIGHSPGHSFARSWRTRHPTRLVYDVDGKIDFMIAPVRSEGSPIPAYIGSCSIWTGWPTHFQRSGKD